MSMDVYGIHDEQSRVSMQCQYAIQIHVFKYSKMPIPFLLVALPWLAMAFQQIARASSCGYLVNNCYDVIIIIKVSYITES